MNCLENHINPKGGGNSIYFVKSKPFTQSIVSVKEKATISNGIPHVSAYSVGPECF